MPDDTKADIAAPRRRTVGLVGARGHTGAELIRLLDAHKSLKLDFVSSRRLSGRRVSEHIESVSAKLMYEDLTPAEVSEWSTDVVILALPNECAQPFVDAIDKRGDESLILDLSADHRFDDRWSYGLPERYREAIASSTRIANPGCYATGMHLALWPVLDLLEGPVHVFGVSGYSGAGTVPSERNDPERLRDNLMPYALAGHLHEREVTHHLGHPIRFMPHVAEFFRGINLTISMVLKRKVATAELRRRFEDRYSAEPLVRVQPEGSGPPQVRDIVGRHEIEIGGFTVDDDLRCAVVVATLDNLLKGAATQAQQNINLACGYDELEGIRPWLQS